MENEKPKIDLSSIEEVRLNDNKRYIKYIDLNTGKPVMLDITKSNKSAKEIIESLQNSSSNFNTNDAIFNTNGVLGLEQKYAKHELNIMPVEETIDYEKNKISNDKKQIIEFFKSSKNNFRPPIKYINIEEGIALDTNNNVIMCWLKEDKTGFNAKYADTTKYEVEVKEQPVNETPKTPKINEEEVFNKLINNQPIEINGQMIDAEFLINNQDQIYRFIPENQIEIWKKIFAKYDEYKKQQEQQNNEKNPPKILQLTNSQNEHPTKQAAFVSNNLTLFIGGFTTGIIFAFILYYLIKIIF